MEEAKTNGFKPTEEMTEQELRSFADSAAETIREKDAQIEELQKQLDIAKKNEETATDYHLGNYRINQMLKKTVEVLIEKYDITNGDLLAAMAESNSLTLEDLLNALAK